MTKKKGEEKWIGWEKKSLPSPHMTTRVDKVLAQPELRPTILEIVTLRRRDEGAAGRSGVAPGSTVGDAAEIRYFVSASSISEQERIHDATKQ